ncbi:hypothetical protein niasHT_024295 [Heterodera trifolii]|uniref:FLYWCH-type domain-containing protein n=1 Tax=Heterodera trifolii TaxID=157864 RepID=A0ABD2JM75_9BILA
MQATLTEKSRTKLQHNGHSYIFHKPSADGEVRFWSCERHHAKDIRCKGRLHTNLNNNVLREVGNHQCEPSAARMEAQRVITKIKRWAEQTMEPPATIRSLALQNVATPRYQSDPTFAEMARCVTSIAFLPIGDLTPGIIALDMALPDELTPVLDWFVMNYTGRLKHDGSRTRPRFDPNIWSVYTRTLQGDDRTNNHSAAANIRLQCAFACSHPSIWHFIDLLQKDQKLSDDDFAKCSTGQEPPQKAKKYREADRRILTMVQNYLPLNNADTNIFPIHHPFNHHFIITFLIGISRNYEMRP